MKRLINNKEITEIDLQIDVYPDNVIATKNSEIDDFESFISECKDILTKEYGFILLEDQKSNRSNSHYLRFEASSSKNYQIVFTIWFQLRISDHVSNLVKLKKDIGSIQDTSLRKQAVMQYNQDVIHHENYMKMKDQQFKVNKHIELSDIIIESSDYIKGKRLFRKQLGIVMRMLSNINK